MLKIIYQNCIHRLSRLFRKLAVLLWALVILGGAADSQAADYAPPLSYSNAQLTGQDFSGQTLRTAEFSNANLVMTNFAGADLRGAVFSASTMTKANLQGADLTNAMLDQVQFNAADLSDAILVDSILLRSIFSDVNIAGADFSNAILDGAQVKELCAKATGVNSKTGVATRDSLECR